MNASGVNGADRVTMLSELPRATHASLGCAPVSHSGQDLAQLLHNAPIGLALLDDELRYTCANEYFAATNGRSTDEFIRKSIYDVTPHLAPHLEQSCRQVLRTGKP